MRAIKVYLQKFSKINIISYLKAASGDKVRSEMSGSMERPQSLVILSYSPCWPRQDKQLYIIHLIAPLMLRSELEAAILVIPFSIFEEKR